MWTSLAATVLVATLIVIGVVTGFPALVAGAGVPTGALTSILMLFLIQHTTNRQTNAVLMKLDELVIATTGAREEVIDIEDRQLLRTGTDSRAAAPQRRGAGCRARPPHRFQTTRPPDGPDNRGA